MSGSEANMEQAEAKVLVVGSAMTDLIAYTPNIPKVGETIMGSSFQTSFGGKGANQAVQCARMGASTAFVATLGKDTYGENYLTGLQHEGINVSEVKQVEGTSTGIAVIWVDAHGMNSIVIIPGANLAMSSEDVTTRLKTFLHPQHALSKPKIALFQNEIDLTTNLTAMTLCSSHGIYTVFNPAPYTSACQNLVPHCHLVCVNEVELQMMVRDFGVTNDLVLTDDASLLAACLIVLDHCLLTTTSPLEKILVTLGALGAVVVDKDTRQLTRFVAPQVTAVDSVGAGDSFLGCLAASLAEDCVFNEAVRRSIICASYSVQRQGAQPSYAHRQDLEL